MKTVNEILKQRLWLVMFAFLCLAHTASAITYYVNCGGAGGGSGTQSAPWNSLDSVNATTFKPGDSICSIAGRPATVR